MIFLIDISVRIGDPDPTLKIEPDPQNTHEYSKVLKNIKNGLKHNLYYRYVSGTKYTISPINLFSAFIIISSIFFSTLIMIIIQQI